jgi:hypothetical protein
VGKDENTSLLFLHIQLHSGHEGSATSAVPVKKSLPGECEMSRANSVSAAALALAIAATLASQPAFAQRAKPQKAPKDVTITNARSEAVTGLTIQTNDAQPRVVATLSKALAPGKSVKIALKKPSGCSYNVLANFNDGAESEAEGLDLCKDGKIRLTE